MVYGVCAKCVYTYRGASTVELFGKCGDDDIRANERVANGICSVGIDKDDMEVVKGVLLE